MWVCGKRGKDIMRPGGLARGLGRRAHARVSQIADGPALPTEVGEPLGHKATPDRPRAEVK